MHLCPELPGTNSPSEAVLNRAVAPRSVPSSTTPVPQVFCGVAVVSTNAA
jgi:hypothetical protein